MKKTKLRTDDETVVDALDLRELCRFCRVEQEWIIELVDYGILDPDGAERHEWRFHGYNIVRARKAGRLHRDLGINAAGIGMILDLMNERDQLIRQMAIHQQ